MKCAVVPREKFKSAVGLLIDGYVAAIPVKENGVLEYKKMDGKAGEKDLAGLAAYAVDCDELPYKSPKEFLFPQVEELMVFDNDSCTAVEKDTRDKIAVVGVKPCDLNALKVLLTVFFQGKYKDDNVTGRRENIMLIGTGCAKKKPGCFCDERGINKNFSSECDIFIEKPVDENDSFRFYSFTVGGDDVLDRLVTGGFGSYSDYEPACGQREGNGCEKEELVIEAEETELFDTADWEGISERCLGCGICTYICPTCHCFDFRDALAGNKTIRYRCWDSCMYPKFTLHASGHNPRASKKERFRQRVLHKYVYVKKNFGYVACTGCGRCIRSCPAGMNIRNVVREISGIRV
ncbi:MAG: hypothetical protein GX754_08620 [Clostridiaceae bacterium]|nr:hypothetical protein [Clostridiaceae bacterium]